ncbi:MAG: hypothetical protein ABIV48_12245 [Pyrinomonadaceae bacterium]
MPRLTAPFQREVLDFVEFLLQKAEKGENGRKNQTPIQRAEFIEQWAKSHSYETPVILDDRREIIYED